ncbi:hypothetical protein SteCoe_38681 [Stentor coeruleus]|uniref:RING-type domain-containing protein n=1 Tax=Stentor coeruleus TaxID=5963 RepID=A0A1R2AL54_9CILI|nr:hypothetical protein SteCoe_38681 [Stentor coeruleus]
MKKHSAAVGCYYKFINEDPITLTINDKQNILDSLNSEIIQLANYMINEISHRLAYIQKKENQIYTLNNENEQDIVSLVKNLELLTRNKSHLVSCMKKLLCIYPNSLSEFIDIEKPKYKEKSKNNQSEINEIKNTQNLSSIIKLESEDHIYLHCGCGTTGKLNKFMISCRHICNDCLYDLLRENKKACPECNEKISDEDNIKYRSFIKMCEGCRNHFNIVKGFMKKMCKHDLCSRCISMCTDGICTIDREPFDNTYGIDLSTVLKKKCVKCSVYYDRMSFYELGKKCECPICEDCQAFNSIGKCCMCQCPFSEYLLNKLRDKKGNLAKVIYRMCPVCRTDCDTKEMHCLVYCDHYICKECFELNVEHLLTENQIDEISKCPICFIKIFDAQLECIINENVFDRVKLYSLQSAGIKFIECPKCYLRNILLTKRRVTCLNPRCNFKFCKDCKQEYHDEVNCQDVFIKEGIKDLEVLNDSDGFTQCPNCRLPYIKFGYSDHVRCLDRNCSVEFCFRGACLRSPTLEHGNHYHRPQCKWFSPYDGHDDKFEKKCSECNRLGRKCNPPKNLRVERRVDIDEAIAIAQV